VLQRLMDYVVLRMLSFRFEARFLLWWYSFCLCEAFAFGFLRAFCAGHLSLSLKTGFAAKQL